MASDDDPALLSDAIQTIGMAIDHSIDPLLIHLFGQYIVNKANAITLRNHGNVDLALSLERECERIYRLLPEAWHW